MILSIYEALLILIAVAHHPTFKRRLTAAHILSALTRHLFPSHSHPTFVRSFRKTCLSLLNSVLTEAPWHSGAFTQPRKMKAIKVPALFDIKCFAWEGHPRETALTLKDQHTDICHQTLDFNMQEKKIKNQNFTAVLKEGQWQRLCNQCRHC